MQRRYNWQKVRFLIAKQNTEKTPNRCKTGIKNVIAVAVDDEQNKQKIFGSELAITNNECMLAAAEPKTDIANENIQI